MMEVRKGRGDPTFINALVNGEVAPEAVFYARDRVGPDLPLTGCIEEFR